MEPVEMDNRAEWSIEDELGMIDRLHAQNASLTTQNSRLEAELLSLLQVPPPVHRAAEEDRCERTWNRVGGVRDYREVGSSY